MTGQNRKRRPRIRGSSAQTLALALLFAILGAALLGPMLSPHDSEAMDFANMEQAPTLTHWFGTDQVGRDLFVRSTLGIRVSISVALITTIISLCIGIPYGALAGLLGGKSDQLMMRIVDGMYCLPGILIVILLVVMFGRNQYLLFAGLGTISWLTIARIVRAETLRLRNAPFIEAARSMGGTTRYILCRHVLPCVMRPIIVYATLLVPGVILAESFISFLVLGIQEPDTSLGVLVQDGVGSMETSPWLLLFPAAALAGLVWALNTIGDRLRDNLDQQIN